MPAEGAVYSATVSSLYFLTVDFLDK